METVAVGLQGLAEIFGESLRGLRSKAIHGRGELNRELVAQYFARRTLDSNDISNDIVASASQSYTRMLQAGSPAFNNILEDAETFTVLDFGCGNAELLRTLRLWGFAGVYVGYDINQVLIAKLNRATSNREQYTDTMPECAADVVFMINVLAYTSDKDIAGLATNLKSLVKRDGTLIIADPWPSWRWETRFDGLALRLRSMVDVEVVLNDVGLKLERSWLAVATNLFGHSVLPFAWLGEWHHDR